MCVERGNASRSCEPLNLKNILQSLNSPRIPVTAIDVFITPPLFPSPPNTKCGNTRFPILPETSIVTVHPTDFDSPDRLTKSKTDLETFFFPQSLIFNSTIKEGMGMPFFQKKTSILGSYQTIILGGIQNEYQSILGFISGT